MAKPRKRGNAWHAEVRRLGVYESGTFPTKSAAEAWIAKTTADIIAGKHAGIAAKTFGELLERYLEEVTPTKRGARWEAVRIAMYLRDPLAKISLRDLSARHFAEWRDRRLQQVGPGSVLREWNLLSNALKRARDEWKWMTDNPLKPVAKPSKPPARARVATADEVARMMQCAGYRKDVGLKTATLRMMAGYLFSAETALRAGELCALDWSEVYLDDGYLKVTGIKPGARKNNAAVRDVPLTGRAIEILQQLRMTHSNGRSAHIDSGKIHADGRFMHKEQHAMHNEGPVFDLSVSSLDALFRKVRDRAAVVDLTYHDSRHAAITMLSRFYDVLDLARIVGHTNVKELMTYYNPTIGDLVGKMKRYNLS